MSITRKSSILFQLILQHDYYHDGLSKGLTFALTQSGEKQVSRFNGRFVDDEGGGFVVFPVSTSNSFADNVTLSMILNDPQFPIFTDLPDLQTGNAWYCNNLGTQETPTAFTQMLVRPNQFVIDFTGKGWPATAGAGRKLTITRLNDLVVMEKSWYTTPTDPTCAVDMTFCSDGAYTLSYAVDGITKPFTTTFYKAGPRMGPPIFGYFEWYALQARTGKKKQVPGVPSPMSQKVTVQLQARQTIWQYYLVSKTGTKVRQPKIEPVRIGKRVVKFTKTATMVPLPNGSYATELTSNGVLPLEEIPDHEVMLEAQGLAKPMQLPYAAPNLLYQSVDGQPASFIYVYF